MLKSESETLKECFVENIGADEATVIRTFTLGVGSSDNVETFSRLNIATSLLQENTLAFKNRLQTQDLVRGKVNFV